MKNFAISNGLEIVNVIVCDSKAHAEQVSGMDAIETTGAPWIGWTLEVDGWRPPSPYASWNWNGEEWIPPVPRPTDDGEVSVWNEQEMTWDLKNIEQPYPSWSRDVNENWRPPVPHPNDGEYYYWDENSTSWKIPSHEGEN